MKEPREQLIIFFIELDKILNEEFELTVIGGTAMVLGYASKRMTYDCDPWGSTEKELLEKWNEAKKNSGIELAIDTQAGLAQMPANFEDRLQETDFKLKNLTLKFPEKHDLALSKVARLLGNDMDDVLWLHEEHILDYEVLLSRYIDEFKIIYVGKLRNLDLNYPRYY